MPAPYAQLIGPIAGPSYDPRHVEAYMRVAHSTLDGLSRDEFTSEVKLCCACIDEVGHEEAERLAKSFGF